MTTNPFQVTYHMHYIQVSVHAISPLTGSIKQHQNFTQRFLLQSLHETAGTWESLSSSHRNLYAFKTHNFWQISISQLHGILSEHWWFWLHWNNMHTSAVHCFQCSDTVNWKSKWHREKSTPAASTSFIGTFVKPLANTCKLENGHKTAVHMSVHQYNS